MTHRMSFGRRKLTRMNLWDLLAAESTSTWLWWVWNRSVRHFESGKLDFFGTILAIWKLRQDFYVRIAFRRSVFLMVSFLAVGLVVAMLLWWLGGRTGAWVRLGLPPRTVCLHFRSTRDVFIWSFDHGDDWFFMNRGYLKLGQIRSARISGWILSLFAICMIGVAFCQERYNARGTFCFLARHRDDGHFDVSFTIKFETLFNIVANLSSFSFRFLRQL